MEKDYVICGWYTPNYRHWADRLKANLDRIGEPWSFTEVQPLPGGWEANTLRKPAQILEAMGRHPDKMVIFLDVDCEVLHSLEELSEIDADIALHFRCKTLRDGMPRLMARSGTMVLNPHASTIAFLKAWRDLNKAAPFGTVDQRTLPAAIARTPGLSVEVLDVAFCATPADGVRSPVILHANASRSQKKVPGFLRRAAAFFAEESRA